MASERQASDWQISPTIGPRTYLVGKIVEGAFASGFYRMSSVVNDTESFSRGVVRIADALLDRMSQPPEKEESA
jgi:hypothetical protein